MLCHRLLMNSCSMILLPGSADSLRLAGFALPNSKELMLLLFHRFRGIKRHHRNQLLRCGLIHSRWTLYKAIITLYLRDRAYSNRSSNQITKTTSHCQTRNIVPLNPDTQRANWVTKLIFKGLYSSLHFAYTLCLLLYSRFMISWQSHCFPFITFQSA